MNPIPIPARLSRRPTRSGLVVPYVSLEIDGVAHLGETRGIRVAECIVNRLCQACGQHLAPAPFVFIVTERMLADGSTREPPLHPECAAYSAKACPMVSGRMPAYSRADRDHTGAACTLKGCDCGGIVTEAPGQNRGAPAQAWFTAWIMDYAIGVKDAGAPLTVGNVTGCVFTAPPVKVRPIKTALEAA